MFQTSSICRNALLSTCFVASLLVQSAGAAGVTQIPLAPANVIGGSDTFVERRALIILLANTQLRTLSTHKRVRRSLKTISRATG